MYFSGHGLEDDEGRLFLAMTNTRRDGLLFTALPAQSVNDAMNACLSREKVLIPGLLLQRPARRLRSGVVGGDPPPDPSPFCRWPTVAAW